MKILVFAHELVVGGTSWNSIELSAALRDAHGHDVVFFATPGPMLDLVIKKGLRFIPAPMCDVHPSLARMRTLREVVHREKPDVVHAWDWFQGLEAYYAAHLPYRVPTVVTDMYMTPTRVLPRSIPTTYGTPKLVDQARLDGRHGAALLLPPVDVHSNAPDVVDADQLRRQCSVQKDDITLVTVSRLNFSMKFESIVHTISAVDALGAQWPLRFLIVGDGEARGQLEEMAQDVNRRLGRQAVILTGQMLDPRPAYALADIVIGMGGSSLRGLAFSKPVIVVGERGFSEPFTPQSAEFFLYEGMYGIGAGEGPGKHIEDVRTLVERAGEWRQLGCFGRDFVLRHFSIEVVSGELARVCSLATKAVPSVSKRMLEGCRIGAIYLRERLFLRRAVDRTITIPS